VGCRKGRRKAKSSRIRRLLSVEACDRLDNLNALGLETLGSLDDLKLDLLAFLEAAEAVALDSGVMNENVLTALTADESKTLGVVEPLNDSLFHCLIFL
jgi:hypothetical protein